MLQDNTASRALHTKCGFRLVGRRERIARDCHGRWLDTYLMERRAKADEPEGIKNCNAPARAADFRTKRSPCERKGSQGLLFCSFQILQNFSLCPVHPAIAGGDTANFFLQLWGQLALF